MNNPQLLKKVNHTDFKEFSKEQMLRKGGYKSAYLGFLLLTGILFFGGIGYVSSVAILRKEFEILVQLGWALLFCCTLLIVLHELLHGLAYKLVGAKKVYYGAVFSRFIFFAGSDEEKLSGVQYRFVALFPFVCISFAGILSLALFPSYFLFTLTTLFIHTLFCGGDFAVLNFIQQYELRKLYTYDSRAQQETYFYLLD